MPRLIDADELLKHAYDSGAWKDAETGFHQRVVDIEDIEDAPTVDAEPVQPTEFEWCHDCKEYDQNAHCCHRWTKVIRNTVNDLKTQGYEPVRYGLWEYVGGNLFRCSECHEGTADDDNILTGQANYCGVCGARMNETCGRWHKQGNEYRCSECGDTTIVAYKNCPNCGARMDEVAEVALDNTN